MRVHMHRYTGENAHTNAYAHAYTHTETHKHFLIFKQSSLSIVLSSPHIPCMYISTYLFIFPDISSHGLGYCCTPLLFIKHSSSFITIVRSIINFHCIPISLYVNWILVSRVDWWRLDRKRQKDRQKPLFTQGVANETRDFQILNNFAHFNNTRSLIASNKIYFSVIMVSVQINLFDYVY